MTRQVNKDKIDLRKGIRDEMFKDVDKLEMAESLLREVNETFAAAFKMSLSKGTSIGGVIAFKLATSISEIKLIKETLYNMADRVI